MNILNNINLLNKALFIEDLKILVLSDIHIGYEESLNKQGIFIPRFQFQETMNDLKDVFERLKRINSIIILGDLKHEFGEISRQEWRETIKFLDELEKKAKKIILIKGNHDKILGPIAKRKSIELKDFHKEGDYFFAHGDIWKEEAFKTGVKSVLLGHLHPAVVLREGAKSEKYKCFLVGEYKSRRIIILPSFLPLIEGTDSFSAFEKILGRIPISDFDVYAIENKEIYALGKRKNL
jgi:hypothetical protein